MEGGEPQQGEEICWKCPQVGCFKMNCDAALDMEGRRMGMGIILRNHEGKVRAAWSLSKPGLLEPAAAEAVSLFHGMKFCKELGISNLTLEGDSLVVISAIQKRDASSSRIGHLIGDIVEVWNSSPGWQFEHVRRESNRAAHGLAKAALKNVIDRFWEASTPDCIGDIVWAERSDHA
jgi:ribonuclease HI